MPTVASIKPAETQGAVIAMSAQGLSMSKIAKSLAIDRETVKRILASYNRTPQDTARSERLTPYAYDAVEKALKSGDARIGMDWLKATVLSQPQQHVHVAGDVSLVSAVSMVPASTTSSPGTQPALPAPTEAPAKPGPSNIGLSSHTNFSQFSDAQLEEELARRKAARGLDCASASTHPNTCSKIIDAEVVP